MAFAAKAGAATFVVNSFDDAVDVTPGDGLCADINGNCTLRAAVIEANALAGSDVIMLGAGTYKLTIPGNAEHYAATGDLDIRGSVTITGDSPATTIIDGGGLDRVFEVILSGGTTISRVTIMNGVAGANTPGYFSSFAGGGISHVGGGSGTLLLTDVVVRDNSAASGGGIHSVYGTISMTNTSVYNNTATAGSGGGIVEGLADYLIVRNSTISGNSATYSGGGISSSNNASQLYNVTITNNIADSDNDGTGNGGGFAMNYSATPVMVNSILAGNIDNGGEAPDCNGVNSSGYNLIGIADGCPVTPYNGDLIGSAAMPLDPGLGPLRDNGGFVPTHALLNGSPALDSANPAPPGSGGDACIRYDARGIIRTTLAPCDMGAYEAILDENRIFDVNSTMDAVDGLIGDGRCETAPGNNICTLRAAVQETNALIGTDTINVPAGLYVLSLSGTYESLAASGDLNISDSLIVNGAGAVDTIIDGNATDRLIASMARQAEFNGLTLRNGRTIDGYVGGGAVYAPTGRITFNDCVITGNTANPGMGGGIAVIAFTTLELNNTIVRDNVASSYGGGVANFTFGKSIINNSTISGNRSGSFGGGLMNSFMSIATITNSTISGNTGQTGGGIGTLFGSGTVTLTNSTVSGNTATLYGGGGVYLSYADTLNLRNATITGNRTVGLGDGGGINSSGIVNTRNSLIAGNTDVGDESPDCTAVVTSQGYNLIGNDSGCAITASVGDLIGSSANPINPLLDVLANNGGPTATHALLSGSPALNAGNPAVPGTGGNSCEALDQLGADRAINAPCDIGAVETVLADLSISAGVSVDPVLPSGQYVYTLSVTNEGPDAASNLVLIDSLPEGVTLNSASGTNWTCNTQNGTVTCVLGSLPVSASSNVDLIVTAPDTSGLISNLATIAARELDLDLSNNSILTDVRVNAAPVIGNVDTAAYELQGTPVAIAPKLTVTDVDDTSLEGAVVRIESGYKDGRDLLSWSGNSVITSSWDAATGTLTLTGSATLAQYKTALRAVTYANIGTNTAPGNRVISFTVNDGDVYSQPASATVTLNNPPPPTAPAAPSTTDGVGGISIPATISAETTAAAEMTDAAETPADMPNESEGEDDKANAEKAAKPRSHAGTASPVAVAASTASNVGPAYPLSAEAADAEPNASTGTVAYSRGELPPTSAGPGTSADAINEILWNHLDDMNRQLSESNQQETAQEKILVGAAKSASLILIAGVMNWYLKAGSLLASLLSSIPLWTPFDPLPILSLTRREKQRKLRESARERAREDARSKSVGHLLDACRHTNGGRKL